MAEYGYHPTVLQGLSDEQLYSMYLDAQWSQLDEYGRQAVLQESVNRAALANGEVGACRVEFADLGSGTLGVQSGDRILLDRNAFVNDVRVAEYQGQTMQLQMDATGFQALETVLHEDIHAWQNQCLDGTIQNIDPQLLEEYRANNFDPSLVTTEDGATRVGQQYLNSNKTPGGYYLYYAQSTERDAHRFSELRTAQIASALEQKYGPDPAIDAYRDHVQTEGFAVTMAAAQKEFQTPYLEQDVNQTLMNQYYGRNEPVSSPRVRESVKQEMVASYEERMNTMALNQHVTASQYDQSLRDAVNAYYTHAMNDPNMTQEEAIQSTAQMAEQAITASEEFHASQAAEQNGLGAETTGLGGETTGLGTETGPANDNANEAGISAEPGGVSDETGGVDNDDGGIE